MFSLLLPLSSCSLLKIATRAVLLKCKSDSITSQNSFTQVKHKVLYKAQTDLVLHDVSDLLSYCCPLIHSAPAMLAFLPFIKHAWPFLLCPFDCKCSSPKVYLISSLFSSNFSMKHTLMILFKYSNFLIFLSYPTSFFFSIPLTDFQYTASWGWQTIASSQIQPIACFWRNVLRTQLCSFVCVVSFI